MLSINLPRNEWDKLNMLVHMLKFNLPSPWFLEHRAPHEDLALHGLESVQRLRNQVGCCGCGSRRTWSQTSSDLRKIN